MFWSDERLLNAEAGGDLPGNPGELAEFEQDDLAPALNLFSAAAISTAPERTRPTLKCPSVARPRKDKPDREVTAP